MQQRRQQRQRGYVLLVILLTLSLFIIALAKAAPAWRVQIERERESRSIDRAREYRMAIKRYFHKYGRYPPSIDALVKKDGQGLRYLREAWADPLASGASAAGADAPGQAGRGFKGWQILHYGQAVTAKIVDQPPAAASGLGGISGPDLTGAAASGGGEASAAVTGPEAVAAGGASGMAESNPVGGRQPAGSMQMGQAGAPGNMQAANAGAAAAIASGPVIGVAPLSKRPAVHAFNGYDIPNDWQFVYNYALDPSLRTSLPGGAAAGPNNGLKPASTRPGGMPASSPTSPAGATGFPGATTAKP